MAVSLLNSTSVIQLTCGTMWSMLVSGCNITHWMNFNPHYPQQTHTLFDHLIFWRVTSLGKWVSLAHQEMFIRVSLAHQEMFIHGPFEFASADGRKTRDCISQPDWDVLKAHCDMFHNPFPRIDVPSYSIHVDCRAHVTFHSDAIARQLIILAPNANDTPGALHSPWQKVMVSWANHPIFFFFNTSHDKGASSEVWHDGGGLFEHPLRWKVGEVREYGTLCRIFGISTVLLVLHLACDLARLVR